jgi:hypothetical protein
MGTYIIMRSLTFISAASRGEKIGNRCLTEKFVVANRIWKFPITEYQLQNIL